MIFTAKTTKVSFDLFSLQLIWTLWFFGITSAIFLIFGIAGPIAFGDSVSLGDGDIEISFFHFLLNPSKIYMLVIGIMSISSFLPFYIRAGITRRDYFIGAMFSGIALSVFLTLLSLLVTILLSWIQTLLPATFPIGTINELFPHVSLLSGILISIVTVFMFYTAGWLISAGFYRYHWVIGMLFIAIAILYVSASELLLDTNASPLAVVFTNIFADMSMSLPVALSLITLLSVVILWGIRRMTRNIAVKIR